MTKEVNFMLCLIYHSNILDWGRSTKGGNYFSVEMGAQLTLDLLTLLLKEDVGALGTSAPPS